MIIDEFIRIKIDNKNRKYYENLGYIIDNEITINIKDLSKGSHQKINVKCDYCGKQKTLEYRYYISNIKKANKFACSCKCGSENDYFYLIYS